MSAYPNIFAMRARMPQDGSLPPNMEPPMMAPPQAGGPMTPPMVSPMQHALPPQPLPPNMAPPMGAPPVAAPGGPMAPPNTELYRRPMTTAMPIVPPRPMPPQPGMPGAMPGQDPRLMQNIFARRALQY